MPIVSLPSSLLSSVASDAGTPLARLLGLLTAAYSLSSGRQLEEAELNAALDTCWTLAIAGPFDPDERTAPPGVPTLPARRGMQPLPLIEAVLRLETRSRPTRIVWPTTPDGFAGRPAENEAASERLAALLLAAGCNPWIPDPGRPHALPVAVRLAALHGMGGLFARFLDHPAAWAPGVVAAAQIDDAPPGLWPGRTSPVPAPLIERLATDAAAYPCLAVLLERGIPGPARPAVLADASPGAIEAVAEHTPPKLSPVARRQVEQGWRRRAVTHELSASDASAMACLLWADSTATALAEATVSIERFLSNGWASNANGSSALAYGFAYDRGAAELVGRAPCTRPSFKGTWSCLAAAAFSRILQAQKGGALGWSVAVMIGAPIQPGCLRDAIGFDWRPGIPVDALVALALFGQCLETGFQRSELTLDDSARRKRLTDFAFATGIPDLEAWGRSHMASAVRATAILGATGGTKKATKRLLMAWNTWATTAPQDELRRGLSEAQRADLLWVLVPAIQRMDDPRPALWRHLFPFLDAELARGNTLDLSDAQMDPHTLRAATGMALACASPEERNTALDQLGARGAPLPAALIDALKGWTGVLPLDEQSAFSARVAALSLHDRLPVAKSRGPRRL